MNKNDQRRTFFTSDAKLAIRRVPAATMATGTDGKQTPPTPAKVTLEGYAMVWNVLSTDRGGFRVRLKPGSARFTDEVHALFHHNFEAILGATGNATLTLTSDDVGVKAVIDLPDTTTARDVTTLVDGLYVRGMSFSMLYDPLPESTTTTEGGIEIMDVTSFLCDEVTVTAIPSFTSTSIGVQEDPADADNAAATEDRGEMASVRIEQSIRFEQFRLAQMEL